MPFPSPGDLPKPGIKPRSPAWQVESVSFDPPVYSKHILFVLAILVSKRFILCGKAFQTTLYCILSVWFHQLLVEIYILAENIENNVSVNLAETTIVPSKPTFSLNDVLA